MTQLVIGASGLVGSHILGVIRSSGQNARAAYRNTVIADGFRVDIAHADEVNGLFRAVHPKIVYLPAALTNVDYCELNPQETYRINVRGVENVVKACNAVCAKIVYFSSDYIFDGLSGPYEETDTVNPISEYGRQKLAAEHYIALFAEQYIIIRTTVVYGWESQGKNFIFRLVKSLRENMTVKAPVDQIGTPTFVNNLAEISVQVAASAFTGAVNVAGPDCVDRFAFAQKAAETFGLDKNLVLPVHTAELGQPAKRPLFAGLKTNKVLGLAHIPLVNYSEGLKTMASNSLFQTKI